MRCSLHLTVLCVLCVRPVLPFAQSSANFWGIYRLQNTPAWSMLAFRAVFQHSVCEVCLVFFLFCPLLGITSPWKLGSEKILVSMLLDSALPRTSGLVICPASRSTLGCARKNLSSCFNIHYFVWKLLSAINKVSFIHSFIQVSFVGC